MNYVVSAIDVYRNGVKMAPADFTATNGTSIVLANACTVGDTVEVISYPMITYSDAVKRTGDTMTGNLTVPMVVTDTPLMFRNRIINGDMRIDQRGNTAATTGFPVDRWQTYAFNTGSITRQISTVAPANFTSSLSWVVGTAGTRNSGDAYIIQQAVEALNIADANQGTANALPFTLSFWVRSSITGLYSGALTNSANDRCCAFTYSINIANTWEYKTVTIPGDTTGTWYTDNRIGILVRFDLGSGSTFQAASAGSWLASANRSGIAGTVSLAQTTGASFYLTGVQLEVGSVATPFERRPYGLELSLCQRYYQKSPLVEYHMCPAPGATYASTYPVHFPTYMRTTPTLGFSYVTSNAIGSYTSAIYSSNSGFVHFISASVSTNAYMSFYWTGSAEL